MKHYSASQINMFLRCSAQWMFRYVLNLKKPPSGAMVQGSAYHEGLDANFRHKLESKVDLTIDAVKEVTAQSFDKKSVDVEWQQDESKGQLKDETISLAAAYVEQVAPKRTPKKIEQRFELETDQDYTITGIIDLVADDKIVEHKTTGRSPAGIDDSHLLQAAIYSIAMPEIKSVEFDYAVKNKTPKMMTLSAQIDDVTKNFVLGQIARTDHAIQKGVFIPNRSSFMCSRKGCGYWNECEMEFGGRVK